MNSASSKEGRNKSKRSKGKKPSRDRIDRDKRKRCDKAKEEEILRSKTTWARSNSRSRRKAQGERTTWTGKEPP